MLSAARTACRDPSGSGAAHRCAAAAARRAYRCRLATAPPRGTIVRSADDEQTNRGRQATSSRDRRTTRPVSRAWPLAGRAQRHTSTVAPRPSVVGLAPRSSLYAPTHDLLRRARDRVRSGSRRHAARARTQAASRSPRPPSSGSWGRVRGSPSRSWPVAATRSLASCSPWPARWWCCSSRRRRRRGLSPSTTPRAPVRGGAGGAGPVSHARAQGLRSPQPADRRARHPPRADDREVSCRASQRGGWHVADRRRGRRGMWSASRATMR